MNDEYGMLYECGESQVKVLLRGAINRIWETGVSSGFFENYLNHHRHVLSEWIDVNQEARLVIKVLKKYGGLVGLMYGKNQTRELDVCEMIRREPQDHLPRVLHVDKREKIIIMEHAGETLASKAEALHKKGVIAIVDVGDQIVQGLDELSRLRPNRLFGEWIKFHGDLGPKNVLLDDVGHVTLIDFSGSSEKTAKNIVNPYYAAPEKFRDWGKIDVRADTFSLAAIMYELLSGYQRPFFDSQVALSKQRRQFVRGEMKYKDLNRDQLPADFGDDAEKLDRLNLVLRKGMAHNADDRYENPAEFMEALGQALMPVEV